MSALTHLRLPTRPPPIVILQELKKPPLKPVVSYEMIAISGVTVLNYKRSILHSLMLL